METTVGLIIIYIISVLISIIIAITISSSIAYKENDVKAVRTVLITLSLIPILNIIIMSCAGVSFIEHYTVL